MRTGVFPPWVVLHIPHDSVYIPPAVRRRIRLTDEELDDELLRMTDFWTYALFANGIPVSRTAIAPVNRLVVDVERFVDDENEPMAKRGMGVVYTATSSKGRLRNACSKAERNRLVNGWYRPHHERLTGLVDRMLSQYGKAIVLDCHSFASKPLPYEENPQGSRPEICLGSDAFHTPAEVLSNVKDNLSRAGFEVGVNSPFSGALTPMKHYRSNPNVMALMVEVRRDLYEDEKSGAMRNDFAHLSRVLVATIARGLHDC